MDIHNEARRLAELKKLSAQQAAQSEGGQEKAGCTCVGNEGSVCACAPGKCECAGCQKKGGEKEQVLVADAGPA